MKRKKHKNTVKVALLHSSSLSSSASAKSFSSSVSCLHRFPCYVNMTMERSVRMFGGVVGGCRHQRNCRLFPGSSLLNDRMRACVPHIPGTRQVI